MVQEWIKEVYQKPEYAPGVLYYDTNCLFHEHVQDDPFFKNILLPVDVFHFKNKHKETHAHCQEFCNPAMFPELTDGKGGWVFNSSAAEQINSWFGRFLPVVRDMLPHHFDFFLDEMIKQRNRITVAEAKENGKVPIRFARSDYDEED